MDNKHIKNSDSSKILADKFLQILWYEWRKVLANEKWARLTITGISKNRYFLLKLYSNFYRLKNKPILRSVQS